MFNKIFIVEHEPSSVQLLSTTLSTAMNTGGQNHSLSVQARLQQTALGLYGDRERGAISIGVRALSVSRVTIRQ